ncbi:hypothetical protein OH687_22935 [Burkholderia anthina]|nr:hypothetical protein OH687_22935 [Burkholderia anthina]
MGRLPSTCVTPACVHRRRQAARPAAQTVRGAAPPARGGHASERVNQVG